MTCGHWATRRGQGLCGSHVLGNIWMMLTGVSVDALELRVDALKPERQESELNTVCRKCQD